MSDVASQVNIDSKRIYVAGFSNGAAMAHRLACERADKISAIAAVSGENQFSLVERCDPAHPISVLQIHGTADIFWSYYGADSSQGFAIGATTTIVDWAIRNQCALAPNLKYSSLSRDFTSVVRTNYANCASHAEVISLTVVNGGHTWPGGWQALPESTIGLTSKVINANQEILQFFKRH